MTEVPAHHGKSAKTNYSSTQKQIIHGELEKILESTQFENAPTVSAFLDYVVKQHLAGNDEYIKAYTIATEGLGRSERFDPTDDTIVRTTAGRLRKTLQAYYSVCEREPQVLISLPKGRYVPVFEFIDQPSPPAIPPVTQRRGMLFYAFCATMAVLTAALFAFSVGATLLSQNKPDASSAKIVINVHPASYIGPQVEPLAKAINFRLPPALARIGIAEIVPPDSISYANGSPPVGDDPTIRFILKATVLKEEDKKLLWKLLDSDTGRILWTGSESISGTEPDSLFLAVDRMAFHVLGVGGAVPLAIERYYGNVFDRSTCISRGQIVEAVEDSSLFPAMRDCLERIVAASPNDASAWSVLSIMYTDRSRFYQAGSCEERAAMVEKAEQAAEKAVRLSPTAYLTKTALMHLALRQGRIEDFDRLQQEIRDRYPGDIFLQIRIATRLARLGRGNEALEIFETAEKEFGINLKNWAPGIAVAHFANGDFELARQQIMRSSSDLRFVLVLKAAILGKLDRKDEAAPVIAELLRTNPDIQDTFYPWLANLSWSEPVINLVADGLTRAGLDLRVNEHVQSDL